MRSLPAWIVLLQLFGSLAVAAGFASAGLVSEALSALLAGAVVVVPAGYLAWRIEHERSAGRVLGQSMMKFVVTMALMALTFAVLKPAPLGFFVAFVLMQTMYLVGPVTFGAVKR